MESRLEIGGFFVMRGMAQYQYFSDGPSKHYSWQGGSIVFKHRTNKETTNLSYRTAILVQALKSQGENKLDTKVVAALREKYSVDELKGDALCNSLSQMASASVGFPIFGCQSLIGH